MKHIAATALAVSMVVVCAGLSGVANSPPAPVIKGAACFSPDTPHEIRLAVEQAIYGLGLRYFTTDRWQNPQNPGTPVQPFTPSTLTYSVPPDGIAVPPQFSGDSTGTNVLTSRLNTLFNGNTAQWKQIFRDMFDEWTSISGNIYIERTTDDGATWPTSAGNNSRGDIRIVMRNIDGPSGLLGYNTFPQQGDMLLDAAENWASPGLNFRLLRNTISHEHGHGLGLLHSCPVDFSKLMEPVFNSVFQGPQLDDIRGVHDLYGDRYEPNNLVTEGTDLVDEGLFINSPLKLGLLSMHRFFDNDNFILPDNNPADMHMLSVSVSPVGASYMNGPQDQNGFCTSASLVNSGFLQDLVITVRNPAGATVATANAAGLGSGESIVNFPLSSPGRYSIRISSASPNTFNSVQLSDLEVTISAETTIVGDLDGDGCVGAGDLSNLLGSWLSSNPVADLTGDGVVNAADLAELLARWGDGC
ncbi:MAG: matrixin family metalloprotease [Planctomycetota bacterium]|nr:matrixin family metalloprotease [Planctomycetota bacterium]